MGRRCALTELHFAATDGWVSMPARGPAKPAVLGVQVTVILHNTLPEATSIVFSGQHQQKANGHPAQPQVDGTRQLTSLTDAAPAVNGSVTYTFTAGSPGTYLYESGTDVAKQREMGLAGALVVRPPGQADHANGRADSLFDSTREYVYLMSEVDPDLHLAVERKRAFDVTKTTPRYFFINGRSMPDTIAPNNAAWLPNQPYGSLVHLKPFVPDDPDSKPALVRYLNAGSVNYPFHPHGSDQRVIPEDGQPALGANGTDASIQQVPHRHRPRAERGHPGPVGRRGALESADQPDPGPAAPVAGPDRRSRHRNLVQREPVPRRRTRRTSRGCGVQQPVRRVLHGRA
jgi:FtsP/CotA-like multicopper oxidase with cupredoxin domain